MTRAVRHGLTIVVAITTSLALHAVRPLTVSAPPGACASCHAPAGR
jgi:hypothetical protein|nr:hypothetical protein [Kofleriaceae bacterium]